MDPLLYISLLVNTFQYVVTVTRPQDGCTGGYDVRCLTVIYCTNNLNNFESFIQTRDDVIRVDDNDGCSNFIYHYNPYHGNTNYYSKVSLEFKYNEIVHQDPLTVPNVYQFLIVSLNLSDNGNSISPSFMPMDNLMYLNMSRNNFNVAKLSNKWILPLLSEIDMSFNLIKIIEVNEIDEFPYKNLTKLNLSHNLLREIPDATFDSFSKLTSLDLSNNYISQLTIGTFEGVKHLKYLDLSNNEVSNINSSMFRFTDLTTLNISHNKISTIEKTDFAYLKKLVSVDLSHNYIVNIEKSIFCNMIFLNTININNNKIDLIDRDTFLNNTFLTKINISNNKLKTLPKDMFKDKIIFEFSITGNSLEGSLVKGLFEGLRLVLKLDLSYQQVTSIEDYAFFGLEKIEELLLNHNNIGILSEKSFKSLHSLVHLDLSNNKITSIEFNKEDLVSLRSLMLRNNYLTQIKYEYYSHLNSLRVLDLSNNNISSLQSKAFKSLRDLISFEIHNNPLSGALQEGTFDGLNSLPSLDISGSQLTIIKNESFNGMSQLKDLNISHSNISAVEYNTFSHTGAVESLDLSYNAIVKFTINSTELKNLRTLFLSNNRIKSMFSYSFQGLVGLTTINLAHNEIQIIDSGSFFDQPKLMELDLSYNSKLNFKTSLIQNNKQLYDLNLSGIRTKIEYENNGNSLTLKKLYIAQCDIKNVTKLNLQLLPYIKYLDLNNNTIQKLDSHAFSKLNYLNILDLSYNLITYIQPGSFKDNIHLQWLNISHNSLTTLTYGILRGLSYLSTLDISYNYINDLESERFYEAKNLEKLIVDHNEISTIPADDFNRTNLKTLSIGENPIPCDIIVNLKKSSISFEVTSIRFDINNENSHGITCKKRNAITHTTSDRTINDNKLLESEKILNDIRDIMSKVANERNTQYPKETNFIDYLKNITDNIEKSSNDFEKKFTLLTNYSSVVSRESNYTNVLLQKILKALIFNNTFKISQIPLSKDNATFDSIILYVNKIKQDLGEVMAVEKQNVLDELESKISSLNSRVRSVELLLSSTKRPSSEKLVVSTKPVESTSQPWFIETCVALILIIIVIYILFKFYKSNMFVRARRTYSSRELPGSMESPNL
ncbi:toll-like receptor 3 [Galleria mellonella]|uniref:Toll-like receptor 3 n=1 Tax=Galleria mellonella TaxID=7137 RepID=A0A6J1W8A9_GALME|nr:toll-like receptor 3 [Galleria mellonella]XP_026749126.2 toll-like receptor 3 [Galleria mellonella]